MFQAAGGGKCGEEECIEHEANDHGGERFLVVEKFFSPTDFHQNGAADAEWHEEMPATVERDGDEADVEQRDVGKKSERVVVAGGEQAGCEEAAEHAENGDDFCLHAHGEQEGCGGDEHHQTERGDRAKELEVVDRATGEGDGVKRDDAAGAQRLGGDGVTFAREHDAADDEADAEEKTESDADLGRDPVVLD